jgi:uncharacterized membrane protein YccC
MGHVRLNASLILASSARTAIAAATSLLVSMLVARLSGLPEAYWSTILTLVIMQSTLGAAWKISVERFLGTILGALSGGLLARFFQPTWLVFALGIFFLGIVCALLRLQNSYRFAGITLAIVVLVPHTHPAWVVALHRFTEVSIGIIVGLVITAIWPLPKSQDGLLLGTR